MTRHRFVFSRQCATSAPVSHFFDELGDQFRMVLQVSVEHQTRVACGVGESSGCCHFFSSLVAMHSEIRDPMRLTAVEGVATSMGHGTCYQGCD